MEEYKLSSYIRVISDSESGFSMVYHSIFGNPLIVSREGVRFLNLFKQPRKLTEISESCTKDPTNIISRFTDIYFLVKPDSNERELLQRIKLKHLEAVRKKQTIDRIGLAISDICNLGCAHCMHFQKSSNNGYPIRIYQRPPQLLKMSWEIAKRCIDYYVELMNQQGCTKGKIHFGNAEPLTNWPIIERILGYCSEIHHLTFEYTINTNLLLLTRKISEILKRYRVRIATSLDGTVKANDTIRITKGGQGTFKRIIKKFDLLEEVEYPLDGFSITVTEKNFDFIGSDIIELAAKRDMKSIAFDYDLVDLVDIPVAKRVSKLMELKKCANRKGIDFFGTWDTPFRNLTSKSLLNGVQSFCAAVEGRSLEFNVDGSIKVCSHSTAKVGDFNHFEEIFHQTGGLFQIVNDRFPGTDSHCLGCSIEGFCGGQCHVTREIVSRLVKKKSQMLFKDMCDFYRTITKALAIEYIRREVESN